VAKAVRELQQAASKTVCSAEWSEEEGLLWFRGKIYVPQNANLRRRVVSLCHDTKVAGHPGCWKTLELVSKDYWWLQMSRYIGQYISTCDLYLRIKPTVTNFIRPYLHQFSQSQWLRKALEKTFRSVLVTSRGNQ